MLQRDFFKNILKVEFYCIMRNIRCIIDWGDFLICCNYCSFWVQVLPYVPTITNYTQIWWVPNVVVAHQKEGIEALHLASGRTICKVNIYPASGQLELNYFTVHILIMLHNIITRLNSYKFWISDPVSPGCRTHNN